jgi:hypothetical protein
VRYPGFVGPTYALKSPVADGQRCVNLYPEIHELGQGKGGEVGYLVSTPGLRRLATVGSGPIRGLYFTSTGRLAVVSGSELYRVSSAWVATKIGDLQTSTGRVDMADNGTQLIVVDGPNGYVVNLTTGVMERITSATFYGADRVTFQDGYFILNNPGTGQFYLSGLYDGLSYDGLDFGTAEGNPDELKAVISHQRNVWMLGSLSTEVFWNSGSADAPFSRIEGGFLEYGCGAKHAAIKFAGTVAWLTDRGQVVIANGFNPQRVSNFAVERAILEAGDFSGAYAWSYQEGGHQFYCLQIPGSDATWCFDSSTGQWHERTWTDGSGNQEIHRGGCYAWAYATHVVGDREDNRIYTLEDAQRTDDGSVITQERIPQQFSAPGLERVFIHELTLDFEAGVGTTVGQGQFPQVMLRVSKDSGRTWSDERLASLGAIGQTKARARWTRLGQGRNWVPWIRVTDPVRLVILGADIRADQGVF